MTVRNAEAWFRASSVRFLIVGGANTAATSGLLIILSLFLPRWIAFSVSFALGIVFSVLMTGRWVFQSYVSRRRASLFAGAYVAIYLCGLVLVQLLEAWGAPPAATVATVIVTAPLSFLAGRLIFANATGNTQMKTDLPSPTLTLEDNR